MTEPLWLKPATRADKPVLKIYNTLTRSKVEFVPELAANLIRWYSCGPTVYDASHMGHARNYVTIDIIRRILSDYFGYSIQFIMNITDVDDKIIVRGRHQHLVDEYMKKVANSGFTPEIQSEVSDYWAAFVSKTFPEASDKLASIPRSEWVSFLKTLNIKQLEENDPKFSNKYKVIIDSSIHLQKLDALSLPEFSSLFSDILGPALDDLYGKTLNNPSIFRKLAEFWEKEFMKDMDTLGVLRPSVLTRVSEYIPEIIECTSQIMANGYGYACPSGSVYFDTHGFDGHKGHCYAKLCPNAADRTTALIEEAEGVLSLSSVSEKKNPADFALWKASKPGEPAWPSPWGMGRPGWAIECSAMAGAVAPGVLDLHSGGIDLAFPHHDNELAQSEAQFDIPQWVNYFIHTGHLHISGLKMSKSLKNFITIRECLRDYTPRQLRLLFLLHPWQATLDYKDSAMKEAVAVERTFQNYFDETKALIRENQGFLNDSQGFNYYQKEERDLAQVLHDTMQKVHAALCDSFDTPMAMRFLLELVSSVRIYVKSKSSVLHTTLLGDCAIFVTKILHVFGVISPPSSNLDFGFKAAQGSANEVDIFPYVQVVSSFRDSLRTLASESLSSKSTSDGAQIARSVLGMCDQLRDQDLFNLGVILEDRETSPTALIKLVDSDAIERIKAEKQRGQQKEDERKQREAALRNEKLAAQMAKACIDPRTMFKTTEYSAWDEEGLPTHDKDGIEITKSRRKKLQKEFEAQLKLSQKYSR